MARLEYAETSRIATVLTLVALTVFSCAEVFGIQGGQLAFDDGAGDGGGAGGVGGGGEPLPLGVAWSRGYGDNLRQRVTGPALAEDGSVFAVGMYTGNLNLNPDDPTDTTSQYSADIPAMFVLALDALQPSPSRSTFRAARWRRMTSPPPA